MSKPSNPLPGKANKAPTAISLSDTEVSENSSGAPIGFLTVADPNKKDTHTFAVDDPRFEIALVDSQWWLYLKRGVTLDYETTSLLTVQVTATDQGGLSKTESFTIGVADVNDAPAITTASLSVDENARFVGSISAADLDGSASGYRNEWRFSLVDDSSNNNLFSIDPSSGALSFVSEAGADYETNNTYNVEVRVEDVTNPILSTTRSISIGVRDVNEAPTTVSLETQTVPENMTGAAIGLLSSEDPDQGDTLSYQIFKASLSGGLLLVEGEPVIDSRFTVDGGNLALAPGSSLDYETTPTIGIVVRATDAGGLSKDQEFNITVSDQNELPTGLPSIAVDTRTVEVTTTRPLTSSDIVSPATQFLNPDNEHVYQFVNIPDTWENASTYAAQATMAGVTGHLVTITSEAEQTFLEEHFPGDMWLSWIAASDTAQEGAWKWTAGPEQGQLLQYTNWDTGTGGAYGPQPDGGTGENFAAVGGTTVSASYGVDTPFKWVDGPSVGPQQAVGYIIEYSGAVTEVSSATVTTLSVDSASITDPDGLGDFLYQWQWSIDGTEWNDIVGAQSQQYEVTDAELGRYVRVEVSFQDGGGNFEHVQSQPEYIPFEEPHVDTKPDGLIELDGHYYQIVEDPNVGPLTASQESGELSFIFEGSQYQGHLATVSSATEEALIEEAIFEAAGNRYFSQEPAAYWLGGEFVNGSWEWTSGPDAGQALTFSDWGGIEASQGSSEPHLVLNMFGRSDINGVWYSYDAGDTALARGYVVEYEMLG